MITFLFLAPLLAFAAAVVVAVWLCCMFAIVAVRIGFALVGALLALALRDYR
jgi:hypothetical protein